MGTEHRCWREIITACVIIMVYHSIYCAIAHIVINYLEIIGNYYRYGLYVEAYVLNTATDRT